MGVGRTGIGAGDVIELHGSVGGQVHRMGLSWFIEWGFEIVWVRSTCGHPWSGGHGPGIIIVGCLRELRVERSWRCLWRSGHSRGSVRGGDRISSCGTEELSPFAVRAVNRQIGDVDIVARSVTLAGMMVWTV